METSIPTPPYEDHSSRPQPVSRKSPSSTSSSLASAVRAAKSGNGNSSNTGASTSSTPGHTHHHNSHRASKRSATAPSTSHSHHSTSNHHGSSAHSPHHDSGDGRHKRVWKACERCRMKKTKCDGEFPCKRCKDDGLVCTAGTRKKTEYKQLPKGYAEVLENTQFALVATVHKLYGMVRAAQAWDLGEPELNERGQPVIHSIAAKLGCIRPNNDPDLPMGTSVFPEDEADLAELAAQLEEQHKQREAEQAVQAAAAQAQAQVEAQQAQARLHSQSAAVPIAVPGSAPAAMMAGGGGFDMAGLGRFDRASSSEELDTFSDMDDYRKNVFGNGNGNDSSVNSASTTMSPQSLSFNDFDAVSTQSEGFVAPSPTLQTAQFANWIGGQASLDMSAQSLQQQQQQQSQMQEQQVQAQQQHHHQQQQMQKLQQQRQRQKRTLQQRQQSASTQSPLSLSVPAAMASGIPYVASPTSYFGVDMLRQGLVESNFGTIKPHVLSCPNPEAMLGMGDPMIFSGGYDDVLM